MRFGDRVEAGRLLGERLRDEGLEDPVVLGLPRGGVVVAAEVAEAIGAPLDVLVARKLGVPWQPELAFGAVAPGIVVLRDDVVAAAGLRRADIDAAAARESVKLAELADRYRGGAPPIPGCVVMMWTRPHPHPRTGQSARSQPPASPSTHSG